METKSSRLMGPRGGRHAACFGPKRRALRAGAPGWTPPRGRSESPPNKRPGDGEHDVTHAGRRPKNLHKD